MPRDDESFRAQVKAALESDRKVFKKEEMYAFLSDLVNSLPGMHVVDTVPVYPVCIEPTGWSGEVRPVLNVKVRERGGEDCSGARTVG